MISPGEVRISVDENWKCEVPTSGETVWYRGIVSCFSHLEYKTHPGRQMVQEVAMKEPVTWNKKKCSGGYRIK